MYFYVYLSDFFLALNFKNQKFIQIFLTIDQQILEVRLSMKLILAIEGSPEIPNILTFLHHYFGDETWAELLHEWENIFFSLLIAAILSFLFYKGSRRREWVPSGMQNFLEWLVESFRDIIIGILGPEGKKFIPFLGTLFIYILCMNLFGLVPFMRSPSSHIDITIALAICVFAKVQYLSIKNMGIKGFLYHLAGSPKGALGWAISPLMFPIEVLTQLSRPITLALRLFGNILGEKILIGFFALIGITILFFFPIQVPFMLLGVLTSIMQAIVFTLLSTIYILLSSPHMEKQEANH